LFERQTGLVKSDPIRIDRSPIRRQDGDSLRDGVGNLSQFYFVLPELFFNTLPVFDVSNGSTPVDDIPMIVAQRFGVKQEPSIFSVEAAYARLDGAGFPRGDKFEPRDL